MLTPLKAPSEINILIVDDTPDNLRLLTKMLESRGYTLRKSLNGRMALQAARRDPPDLILLDINMPDMNGYEVCQRLKTSEITANIPIIFISALDQTTDKVRAFELGGQDYITKPFQELEVLMRVKNQLLIQHQHQQLLLQNQRLEKEIQDRIKAEIEIRKLSLQDEMTGLYNRRGFFFLADQQLKLAQHARVFLYLLFIDLDGLKHVNDSFGHEVGDRMIIDAARLLKGTFRDSDIVSRLGGDEFVVLISSNSESEKEFRSRLQANLDRFNLERKDLYRLSFSIGVKKCEIEEGCFLEKLLEEADRLMYEHKRSKKSSTN